MSSKKNQATRRNPTMGLADAFGAEDRVEVKFSDFYNMMKAASDAISEMKYVKNALEAGVPANYIRSMLDGKPYPNAIEEEEAK